MPPSAALFRRFDMKTQPKEPTAEGRWALQVSIPLSPPNRGRCDSNFTKGPERVERDDENDGIRTREATDLIG